MAATDMLVLAAAHSTTMQRKAMLYGAVQSVVKYRSAMHSVRVQCNLLPCNTAQRSAKQFLVMQQHAILGKLCVAVSCACVNGAQWPLPCGADTNH